MRSESDALPLQPIDGLPSLHYDLSLMNVTPSAWEMPSSASLAWKVLGLASENDFVYSGLRAAHTRRQRGPGICRFRGCGWTTSKETIDRNEQTQSRMGEWVGGAGKGERI
ncbi:MAG: hypothetical protein EPN24_02380 [Candidatus Methanoperedens sp.]|nr:MAG: hypothetical protein EPN24_02380 [Candidatus Methanoperedens sp.]